MRPDLAIGSGAPHEAATWESNVAATPPNQPGFPKPLAIA
jgi:hypothetical protein